MQQLARQDKMAAPGRCYAFPVSRSVVIYKRKAPRRLALCNNYYYRFTSSASDAAPGSVHPLMSVFSYAVAVAAYIMQTIFYPFRSCFMGRHVVSREFSGTHFCLALTMTVMCHSMS